MKPQTTAKTLVVAVPLAVGLERGLQESLDGRRPIPEYVPLSELHEPYKEDSKFDTAAFVENLEGPGIDTGAPVTRRPGVYDRMSHIDVPLHSKLDDIAYADKSTLDGRIQRTLAAKPMYEAASNAWGVPSTIIAAVLMQENFGDPMQMNMAGDGGFGHGQLQGRKAKELGLETVGHSNAYQDFSHGDDIAALLRSCNYEASCAEEVEERASPLKAIDGTTRNLKDGFDRYRNWDEAIQYHRGFVNQAIGRDYLRKVKGWQAAIENPSTVEGALQDLVERNPGLTRSQFEIRAQHEAHNWDLPSYTGRLTRIQVPGYAKHALIDPGN